MPYVWTDDTGVSGGAQERGRQRGKGNSSKGANAGGDAAAGWTERSASGSRGRGGRGKPRKGKDRGPWTVCVCKNWWYDDADIGFLLQLWSCWRC